MKRFASLALLALSTLSAAPSFADQQHLVGVETRLGDDTYHHQLNAVVEPDGKLVGLTFSGHGFHQEMKLTDLKSGRSQDIRDPSSGSTVMKVKAESGFDPYQGGTIELKYRSGLFWSGFKARIDRQQKWVAYNLKNGAAFNYMELRVRIGINTSVKTSWR
jgi:hypothetical protein